jgi:hypothetical protein
MKLSLILVIISLFTSLINVICVGICIKILTEIYKEQTIKRRYEMQKKELPS